MGVVTQRRATPGGVTHLAAERVCLTSAKRQRRSEGARSFSQNSNLKRISFGKEILKSRPLHHKFTSFLSELIFYELRSKHEAFITNVEAFLMRP